MENNDLKIDLRKNISEEKPTRKHETDNQMGQLIQLIEGQKKNTDKQHENLVSELKAAFTSVNERITALNKRFDDVKADQIKRDVSWI